MAVVRRPRQVLAFRDRGVPRASLAWALVSATATLGTILFAAVSSVAVVAITAILAVMALRQALVAAASGRDGRRSTIRVDDVQRHISAARRRNERTDVVVFTLSGEYGTGYAALVESLRLTDSASVKPIGHSCEVEIALDHEGLDRAGVERRIAAQLGELPCFGWATFPDDGVTVKALLECARGRRDQELAETAESGSAVAVPVTLNTPVPASTPQGGE